MNGNTCPGCAKHDTEWISTTNEWEFFVEVWWGEYADQKVTAAKLFTLAAQHDLMLEMRSGRDRFKGTTVMGQALARMRDRVVGQFVLRKATYSDSRRHNEWRLEQKNETE